MPPAASTGIGADRVDDLGHEHHRRDRAGVAAGLGALGDDEVGAGVALRDARARAVPASAATSTPASCARSTRSAAASPSALATSLIGWPNATSSKRRHALRVDPHPCRTPRRPRSAAAGPRSGASRSSTNCLLLRGQQLANRLGGRARPRRAGELLGHEQVDAVGLALHLVVDPGQVDLELLRGCAPPRRAHRSRRRS